MFGLYISLNQRHLNLSTYRLFLKCLYDLKSLESLPFLDKLLNFKTRLYLQSHNWIFRKSYNKIEILKTVTKNKKKGLNFSFINLD